ncbi:MAG: hypothetical protein ACRCTE_05920 [Cellulosilyticaceae bacterium]
MSCGCSNNSCSKPVSCCSCERPRPPYNPCLNAAKEIKENIEALEKLVAHTQASLNKLQCELADLEAQFDRFVREGCVREARPCEHQRECGCSCGCRR